MKKTLVLLLACLPLWGFSQTEKTKVEIPVSELDEISLGLGFGLDYGGIGGNVIFYPHRNIGLFGGIGYNFASVGWNLGAKVRFVRAEHRSKVAAFLFAMYGTNASTNITDGVLKGTYSFYGPTIGLGLDFKSKIVSKDYWSISLNVPFRSQAFSDHMDKLNRYNYQYSFISPITISIGYRFMVQ